MSALGFGRAYRCMDADGRTCWRYMPPQAFAANPSWRRLGRTAFRTLAALERAYTATLAGER